MIPPVISYFSIITIALTFAINFAIIFAQENWKIAEGQCPQFLAKQKQLRLNIGYNIIIFVYDVSNKILSRYSNYIVDVVIWPKFGNSSIFMTEIIITLIW